MVSMGGGDCILPEYMLFSMQNLISIQTNFRILNFNLIFYSFSIAQNEVKAKLHIFLLSKIIFFFAYLNCTAQDTLEIGVTNDIFIVDIIYVIFWRWVFLFKHFVGD